MDSPTFHPSKSHIKALLRFTNINTDIPDDIIIPFFIDYSSSHPFIIFIFQKNKDNELDFIRNETGNRNDKAYLNTLFETFHAKNCVFTFRHSCFYELSNSVSMDLSGIFCNSCTFLWFSTQYELYNASSIYNLSFKEEVISFFTSNPCLGDLIWNNAIIPQPIVAYSFDTIKNSKFQSTFGSKKSDSEPYFTLSDYQTICNDIDSLPDTDNDIGIVRYTLFEPYDILTTDNTHYRYTFSNHIQHTPLCYFTYN